MRSPGIMPTPPARPARSALRHSFVRDAVAALLAGLVLAVPAAAQERIAVVPESGTPMIAMEVLLAVGPMDEAPEHAGIAYLATRSLVEPLRERLDEIGASLATQSYKDAVGLTLTAAPDAWEDASQRLLVALFRDPLDPRAVERERSAIHAELASRAANPADALSAEVDRGFWGSDHPWGRPAVGTAETIDAIGGSDIEQFLRRNFAPERAYVAVVGPVDGEAARRHLGRFLGDAEPRRPEAQAGMPEDLVMHREYSSITTWIAASYRFGEGADLEALRLLTHLATEALAFGPRRPSIYNARGDVFARPGEGEIRFQIVVPPGEADRQAEVMQDVIAEFAMRALQPESFAQSLRTYRGTRLLALSSPEARARELARQLLLTGSVAPLIEFDELTPERLHAAARSLESPVVLLLGPVLRSE